MTLFVSDLHFDHRPPAGDALLAGSHQAERDLVSCLEAVRPDHVVLLGDLFDAWIEYRDLVPKGLTRLLGLLARWGDQGRRITLCVGNHDPWHRNYVERELGFTLRRQTTTETLDGLRVTFGHGDQEESPGRLRRLLRHRLVHRAYAELLPGSSGQTLARMVSRSRRSTGPDPDTITALDRAARRLLVETDAEAVIFGHSHTPSREEVDGGVYLNTGSWTLHRSYVLLENGRVDLRTWSEEKE